MSRPSGRSRTPSLAEAVAREVGLALHTAELLEENRLRLGRQAALVQAAQVMTSELQVETVLQRLVVEVTKLLEAEAADCYLFDSRRGVLRCAAVYGLPAELVEFEFSAEGALAGEAMRRRQAVVSADYEDVEAPHPAYEGFTAAMVAPMTWWGEVRGVIGVGTTDPERRFSREDVEVLEAFASLGSVALRNLASIEQSSRQVRIQRGFFRIASVLAQPLSLDETLDAVAQAASEALGGSFGAVLMPGEGGLRLAGSHELPPAVAELFREGIGGAEALEDAAARKQVLASPSWPTTTGSATTGAPSPTPRALDRSWRSRSRLRGASRPASGWSSSPRSRRSRMTRSSWRTTSREPPAVRSSEPSSSRRSAATARSPSSSRARARCSRASWIPTRSSRRSWRRLPGSSAPTQRR